MKPRLVAISYNPAGYKSCYCLVTDDIKDTAKDMKLEQLINHIKQFYSSEEYESERVRWFKIVPYNDQLNIDNEFYKLDLNSDSMVFNGN
jgi:hypothetical protein